MDLCNNRVRIPGLCLSFVLASGLLVAAWQTTTRHPLTGRTIASVMGAAGADWLDRPEREIEEDPEGALDAIGIPRGAFVADVGAGSGYMTLRLARRVGASGKVYANDIQMEMLQRLRENVRRAGLSNVEAVLGTSTDSRLPAGQMDLILLVDVYHEFSEPRQMLQALRGALKPDGRLVLLEYRKEDPAIPIREEHKMSVKDVRTELEVEGFVLSQTLESLPRQHILIFRVATVKETMSRVIAAESAAVFDSVQVEIDRNGVREIAPANDAEWDQVRLSALRLAESADLLRLGEARVQDKEPDWAMWSAQLKTASMAAASAAAGRSPKELVTAGGRIYEACTSCHRKYAPAL
jgi:ubiquinone/menaquinone biosynthesis C-methylase UbiE